MEQDPSRKTPSAKELKPAERKMLRLLALGCLVPTLSCCALLALFPVVASSAAEALHTSLPNIALFNLELINSNQTAGARAHIDVFQNQFRVLLDYDRSSPINGMDNQQAYAHLVIGAGEFQIDTTLQPDSNTFSHTNFSIDDNGLNITLTHNWTDYTCYATQTDLGCFEITTNPMEILQQIR